MKGVGSPQVQVVPEEFVVDGEDIRRLARSLTVGALVAVLALVLLILDPEPR